MTMNATEARAIANEVNSPSLNSYIKNIDKCIKLCADAGLYKYETVRFKWEEVIYLANFYKALGFLVSRHNSTKEDDAPYQVGYLRISWE